MKLLLEDNRYSKLLSRDLGRVGQKETSLHRSAIKSRTKLVMMTFAFQTCGEYICALAGDLLWNVLRINTEKPAQLWNCGAPRVSDGANGY